MTSCTGNSIKMKANPKATGSKSVVLSVKGREWGVTSQMMRELD